MLMRSFASKLPVILAASLVAFLVGCGSPEAAANADGAPVPVRVAKVGAREQALGLALPGTLRATDHAVVASRVMGVVARADLAAGRVVEAGAVLVEIEAPEMAARLAQAEARLAAILREQERDAALAVQGAAPAEAVRTQADRRRAAEAEVAGARTLLAQTRVAAPFAGVIARRMAQAGDLALPGTPLFALEGKGRLRVELDVPASLPAQPLGARIGVRLPGGEIDGELQEWSPTADPSSRTRAARIALPADVVEAGAGDFVRVFWPTGRGTVMVIPAAAVRAHGQLERVYVVEDGRARLRLVKSAGKETDGLVRVNSGLAEGELVVVDAEASLRDGQVVEVRP